MRALTALFALFVVLVLAGAAYSALDAPRFDPVQYARLEAEAARIERQAQIADAVAPVDMALAVFWRVLPAALVLLAVAGAAAWGSAALIRFRHERRPDDRGLLPVELGQLPSVAPAALGAFHTARIAEAQQQPVPHALTFSPHYSHRVDAGGAADTPVAQLLPAAALPSFRQLLDAGRVGRGNPMLLGFDAESGAPLEGSWLDLYSCGLGGLSGSGKSWTACFLAAQAVLFDTRIVLLDPHASNAESLAARLAPLAGRFLCAPAESPREMGQAVELVADELRRRKAGARGGPLLFIADEYSALQRGELADPLGALVESLGQEGRKLGLYAMVAGQVWTASRAGGTEVRDSLASAFVHRCRPAQARYLTGLTAADLPGDLLELPAGTAYLLNTAGDFRKVVIPQMGPDDLGRVAALLGGTAPAQASAEASAPRPVGFRPPPTKGGNGATGKPDGSLMEACAPLASSAAASPEAARVLALFVGGLDVAAIVRELYGLDAGSGGRKYQDAARAVQALLRAALGKGATNA